MDSFHYLFHCAYVPLAYNYFRKDDEFVKTLILRINFTKMAFELLGSNLKECFPNVK